MTAEDHKKLYDELKEVIYTRGFKTDNLSEAQAIFVNSLESAAFGADLLKVYAEMVDSNPTISLKNLHAFCLGFGIGLSEEKITKNLNSTYH